MKLQLLLTMNFWLCHTVPGLRQLQLLRESQNSIWQQKHPFPVAFTLCNSYNIYIYITLQQQELYALELLRPEEVGLSIWLEIEPR